MNALTQKELEKGQQTNLEVDYVISYRFAATGELIMICDIRQSSLYPHRQARGCPEVQEALHEAGYCRSGYRGSNGRRSLTFNLCQVR